MTAAPFDFSAAAPLFAYSDDDPLGRVNSFDELFAANAPSCMISQCRRRSAVGSATTSWFALSQAPEMSERMFDMSAFESPTLSTAPTLFERLDVPLPAAADSVPSVNPLVGTGDPPYAPTDDVDPILGTVRYHAITAMPVYANKSTEELRLEDYSSNGRQRASGSRSSFLSASAFEASAVHSGEQPVFRFQSPSFAASSPSTTSRTASSLFGIAAAPQSLRFHVDDSIPPVNFSPAESHETATTGLFGSAFAFGYPAPPGAALPSFSVPDSSSAQSSTASMGLVFGSEAAPAFRFGLPPGHSSVEPFGFAPSAMATSSTAAGPAFSFGGASTRTVATGLFGSAPVPPAPAFSFSFGVALSPSSLERADTKYQ